MKFKQKISLLFFCSLFFLFFSSLVLQFFSSSVFVYALKLELNYPRLPTTNLTPNDCLEIEQDQRFACFVNYIYHLAILSTGLVCFFAFVLAGFLYLTSGESVDKNKGARKIMLGAFLGTIVLLVSYLLLNILNPQLINLSANKPIAKCDVDFSCPEGMTCQNGICVSAEPYPAPKQAITSYVEIPLGWLIERNKAKTEIVKIQANILNDLIAEEDLPGNISVQELARCLKKLTQKCDCKGLNADCLPQNGACHGQCPDDPCDKTINNDFCSEFDVLNVNSNLRTAMNDIASQISQKNQELQEEKEKLKAAVDDLKQEKQKLELAEYLMTNSKYQPEARYEVTKFIKEVEKLEIFEEMDSPLLFDLPQKNADDPTTFFILKQGNEEIINIVKSVIFENDNFLPPNWTPPQQPDNPTDPNAVLLNTPEILQSDLQWALTQINDCLANQVATHGCGPTALAIILQYFGASSSDFNPGNIAEQLRNQNEYFCDQGSSNLGLSQWAKSHYNVNYQDLGSLKDLKFDDLQALIRNGKPIMAACSHFGRGPGSDIDWGHITVIRGIEKAKVNGKERLFVFFQDSNLGRIAYEASLVKNYWACYSLVSFNQ